MESFAQSGHPIKFPLSLSVIEGFIDNAQKPKCNSITVHTGVVGPRAADYETRHNKRCRFDLCMWTCGVGGGTLVK